MKDSHPKYKIKQGDTVILITEQFGFSEDVWKQYHNNMCRLDDIIRDILPKHLKEIYLLPELWEKEGLLNTIPVVEQSEKRRTNTKVLFGYNNTLPMKSSSEILYYGVVLALFNGDKVNTLKYEVSVRWIVKEGDKHIIEIDRMSNIYINDQEPDLMADELAVKVGSVLYPLELIVTRKDGIIGINNFKEIQNRWKTIKQKIQDYYEGETLEKYLRLNEFIIMSPDSRTLLKSLKNDWFLYAYFNNIYQTYGITYTLENKIQVPFVSNTKGILFQVKQEISKKVDEQGFIRIKQEGDVCDDRSNIDIESGLAFAKYFNGEKIKGTYSSKYILNPLYNTIDSLMINTSVNLFNTKSVSIVISQIKKQNSYE